MREACARAFRSMQWFGRTNNERQTMFKHQLGDKVKDLVTDYQGIIIGSSLLENTSAAEATAVVVSGPELEAIRTKIVAKYGFMTKVTKFLNSIGAFLKRKKQPYGDRGVVITPS